MDNISVADARKRLEDLNSSFVLVRLKQHVMLPPRYIGKVGYGIYQILNAKRGFYCDNLKGVLIAYDKIQLMQPLGTIHDDMPYIHFDIEADFIVFRPVVSQKLIGIINKVSNDHIGCLVHECFNASIPRQSRDGDTDVCQSSGCELGDEIMFEVTRIYVQNLVLSMSGKFCELRQKAIGNPFSLQTPDTSAVKVTKKSQNSDAKLAHSEEVNSSAKHFGSSTDEQIGEYVSEKKEKKKLKMFDVNDLISHDNTESGNDAVHHRRKKKKLKKHSVTESCDTPYRDQTCLLESNSPQDKKMIIKQEPDASGNDGVCENKSVSKKRRIKKNLDIDSFDSPSVITKHLPHNHVTPDMNKTTKIKRSSSDVFQSQTDSQSDSVKKKKKKRKHSDSILSDLETRTQNVSPPKIKKMKSSDSSDSNSISRKRTSSSISSNKCKEMSEVNDFTQIRIKKEKHSGSSDEMGIKKRKKKHSSHSDQTSMALASPDNVPVKIKKEK